MIYPIAQVLVTLVLVPTTLFLLWRAGWIQPVYWTRNMFQKNYLDMWAGDGTARFSREMHGGTLWWGYNTHTRREFIIFNGMRNWGFQNWKPFVWR